MGSSKTSARNGDRDADVGILRERVDDLERESLIHSTMKGENMAEKAYYLTQQYFGMKSKEDMTEKQDTEVVHLRREANTKVEKAEENANAQVKNLQTKLDEMTKRALKAEDALKDKTISDIPTRFATQDPASVSGKQDSGREAPVSSRCGHSSKKRIRAIACGDACFGRG